MGEGDGFDFWVSEKREELWVLILVFRRELGFFFVVNSVLGLQNRFVEAF